VGNLVQHHCLPAVNSYRHDLWSIERHPFLLAPDEYSFGVVGIIVGIGVEGCKEVGRGRIGKFAC